MEADNRFNIPRAELQKMQIDAADEQFGERVGAVKLLANRAEAAGVKSIRSMGDIVPLLFAHTAYKSYPETWFTEGKWDRMGRWLDTVTTNRVKNVDLTDVADVDDWIDRIADAGFYLSCSSGTTGKCSILPADKNDRVVTKVVLPTSLTWGTGIKPDRQFKYFSLAPVAKTFRAMDARETNINSFAHSHKLLPGEAITVGRVNKMVALRRSVAEGTASPSEIASFETISAQRAKDMEQGLVDTAEAMIASRGERLLIEGLPAAMFQVSELVRGMGYSGKDFHSENAVSLSGGPKGVKLSPDFRDQIAQTFNVAPGRFYNFYSMQDINSVLPACTEGRYHAPPWLIVLLLDASGERMIAPSNGEAEGRAAFLDLSHSGRWGGVITGDKVSVNYGKCACGHDGPTVGKSITRFAEEPGGDKITCAGTIDAYIRGVA
jgi:hypothetical protein